MKRKFLNFFWLWLSLSCIIINSLGMFLTKDVILCGTGLIVNTMVFWYELEKFISIYFPKKEN